MAVSVRELPPLRLAVDIETPSGRHYRWGPDEPDPANVPSNISFSSTMPGGFESAGCTLPRKPGLDYSDLQRLSTATIYGAGGHVASETRLDRTPRTSGIEYAISPDLSGWQAALEDNKFARAIYVDRDLSHWGPPGTQRRKLLNPTWGVTDAATSPDAPGANSLPSLLTQVSGAWNGRNPLSEAWYDAKNLPLASIDFGWTKTSTVDPTPAVGWNWSVGWSVDGVNGLESTGNLAAAGPGSGTTVPVAFNRGWAYVQLYNGVSPSGADGWDYGIFWTQLAVWGYTGVTKNGPAGRQGVVASDAIAHAVGTFAPELNLTGGVNGTVTPSSFVLEQHAFLEPTTAAEIVKQSNRVHLRDWAVWENKTFWYHPTGARGRSWRARIGPAKLEETGPQTDRLFNGVVVSYTDVDGTTRTVGPPFSGAIGTDDQLVDPDPENPATKLGITRWEQLQIGTATQATAIEVGARFLAQAKLLDTSGRASLTGHVMDDRGVLHAAWKVRAGDTIVFTDAADPSPRRVVKASYDHDSRTCSVDLDAPPEALAALLERLGAVLAGTGLN